MNVPILLHTMRHLRPVQVAYQMLYRLHRPEYRPTAAPTAGTADHCWRTEWIAKGRCLSDDGTLCFLNIRDTFRNWNSTGHGALWAYNLNYMDWLCQEGMTFREGAQWMDRFIGGLPANRTGLDPYPTALRGINWVKFICRYADATSPGQRKRWNDALYGQYRLLERKLEYHLLGNHLLEDAFSLFIGSVYFRDRRLYGKARRLLRRELAEQVLPDGAHYEQSAMYHCILLDRLLDCVNCSSGTDDAAFTACLQAVAVRMLGHLEAVVWQDGTIPLSNDAAYGIAPTPAQLFGYAERLGLAWEALPMKECGYRRFRQGRMEALVDVGDIAATYQPGHSHADTFSYELRIDGKPFIVDTGISTYDKTQRREYERGTAAHNTVVVDGRPSSEVWGGFRVGRRAKVTLLQDDGTTVYARHDGYGKPSWRRFMLDGNVFTVEDRYDGEAVSYIHLAEGADAKRIEVEGAEKIEMEETRYSTEYNKFKSGKVMKVTFRGNMKYTVR